MDRLDLFFWSENTVALNSPNVTNCHTTSYMKQLIITYRLKSDTTAAQFENWVKTTDQPTMRGLKRVSRFQTFRSEKLLLGEGSPSFDYIEIFDISDLDGFVSEDMAGAVVQKIIGEFMPQVENVEFVIASEV